jgi:hypothetical protein
MSTDELVELIRRCDAELGIEEAAPTSQLLARRDEDVEESEQGR